MTATATAREETELSRSMLERDPGRLVTANDRTEIQTIWVELESKLLAHLEAAKRHITGT